MLKRITLATLFFFTIQLFLKGQTPQGISVPGELIQRLAKSSGECNDAGTIIVGPVIGQSNDFDDILPYFLCLGDTLPIRHRGDYDLSQDPDTSTQAGITYAFYTCNPATNGTEGPDLATIIERDSCLLTDPPPPNGLIYVASEGDINGNVDFFNDGNLQQYFNNGEPAVIWFAPITIDNFADKAYEQTAPGAPFGPCVNVNIQEAFSVVYLNGIEAPYINTMPTPTGCQGEFVVTGGFPEFNSSATYNATIQLRSDPSVSLVTTIPNHADTFRFSVTVPGIYDVVIEDGKSCGASFEIDMSGCKEVNFRLPIVNAAPGQTNVCLDVTVENFEKVGAYQGSILFDTSKIKYRSIMPNDTLPFLQPDVYAQAKGTISFSWLDFSFKGQTVPDGTVIFKLCFDVVGDLGELASLVFSSDPTRFEVGDADANKFGLGELNSGLVIITDELLSLYSDTDSISCYGQSDGTMALQVIGGVPGYTVDYELLNPLATTSATLNFTRSGEVQNIKDLPAGKYEIRVTDSAFPTPNTLIDTLTIGGPLELQVRLTDNKEPACYGDQDGYIRAEVILGTSTVSNPGSQFTFQWNIPEESTPLLDSIGAGSYSVTITDSRGCQASDNEFLPEPPQLQITPNTLAVTDATCTGSMDGSILLQVSGGTTQSGNYTFDWSNGLSEFQASTSNTALDPGTYNLTLTDDNNCIVTETFAINTEKELVLQTLTSDVTCNGLDNGRGFARVSTIPDTLATLPYTFEWTTFNGTPLTNAITNGNESEISGLAPGRYFVRASDNDPAGCQISAAIDILEPNPLEVELIREVDASCDPGMDGEVEIRITGGTPDYTLLWTNLDGDTLVLDSSFNLSRDEYSFLKTDLDPDSIFIAISDKNTCTDSLSLDIITPPGPTIESITTDAVSCPQDTDGSLSVMATPFGSSIQSYQWIDSTGTIYGNQATANNLPPGKYYVIITAVNKCSTLDSSFVSAPEPIRLDSITSTSPTCPGDPNGRLIAMASGGTQPYFFDWGSFQGNGLNVFPNLAAGTYGVTINDANNCGQVSGSGTVIDPPSIEVNFTTIDSVSCFNGNADGSATATALYADASTGLFNFNWSSGESQPNVAQSTASQLAAGAQSVVVDDGICAVTATLEIPSPTPIDYTAALGDISCYGEADGNISIFPSGGTAPYQVAWDQGSIGNAVSGLTAGLYGSTITDAKGCEKVQVVEIQEPLPLQINQDLTQSSDVSCNDEADGAIAVAPSGGTQPYSYRWDNGTTDAVNAGLIPGSYQVTVTDKNNCTETNIFNIFEPAPIIAFIPDPSPPLCFNDPTLILIDTVFGGTGKTLSDFTYTIDNNGLEFAVDQPATIFAGVHTISIFDPKGCSFTDTIEITQPAELQVSFNPPVVDIELGDSLTRLEPIIVSDLPIQVYNWTPSDYLSATDVERPFVEPLEDRNYVLEVVDVNGCASSAQVQVRIDANRNIYIPNVFSPNGDGLNDYFSVYACLGVRRIISAHIFDRWGNMIYQGSELSPVCQGIGTQIWDGTFNGSELNPGSFVYIVQVEFLDDLVLTYRGTITLIR